MLERRAEILLVEDNDGDVELTEEAFARGKLSANLSVTHDGVEALDFLFRRGAFTGAVIPDLILLDLNMPRMDGKEFLSIVKQDPTLKYIPVIVFTSSSAQADITDVFLRYANSYIIKPFSLEEYIEVLKQVENFWIKLSQLPRS